MRLLVLASVLASFILCGCKGSMIYNNAQSEIRNTYEVLAPMRVAIQVYLDPTKETYDHLLKEARRQYGEDVDIKNLSKDELMVNGMSWTIYNFYVVKYNRFD